MGEADVTVLEGQLRALEARYRVMVEHAPEAIVVLDLDDGRFVEVNAAATRLFGRTRDELLAAGPVDLSPELQPDGRPSPTAKAYLDAAFAGRDQAFEWTHLHPTRGAILCRVHLAAVPQPQDRLVRGSIVDLSHQRESERDRARLQRVIDAAPDIIGLADAHGRTLYLNPAGRRQLGIAEGEDIRGISIREFHSEAGARRVTEVGLPTILRDGVWQEVTEFRSRDGRVFPTSQVLIGHLDERGRLEYISTIARDITAVRAAEELERKMLHAQKLESLGVLAGGIAHDFSNLLVGVLANAGLLARRLEAGSEAAVLNADVIHAAERAAQLAQQMLAYAGKTELVREHLMIGELVVEVSRLISAAMARSTRLTFDLGPSLPLVYGDGNQLRQVVMNLIINASDALAGSPGEVVVRTRLQRVDRSRLRLDALPAAAGDGPFVVIEVSDPGVGMPAEIIARIFEPFFSTKFTGRGLGLAAVLGIVRAHGGALEVESTPGVGTTFRVVLPPVVASRVAAPVPATVLGAGTGLVLVVDDEPAIRHVIGRCLREAGYDVIDADNGIRGLEIVDSRHAELTAIVLDLTMPGMHGTEVLAEVRARHPRLPVLVVSGLGDVTLGLADGFLSKPFRADALIQALARAIENRAAP